MQVSGTTQCRQSLATNNSPRQAPNRAKRKSRWKLKFHHQALPPEYLDHYEASLQQPCRKAETLPQISIPRSMAICSNLKLPETSTSSSPTSTSHTELVSTEPLLATTQQSVVRYKDLPYMGEMTLDNARPRRGRKPKKADICHLIYKNYGTTVVDEPLNLCLRDLQSKEIPNEISMCKFKFTAGATPNLEERRTVSLKPNSNNNIHSIHNNNHNNHNHNNNNNNNNNISSSSTSSSSNNTHHNNNESPSSTNNLRLFDSNGIRNKEIKRKSRKSLAREKLEKTFKERGFLIQTQHLESAQGATYCKFRQLRKFTRYLFRSWKQHLPGDVVNTNSV